MLSISNRKKRFQDKQKKAMVQNWLSSFVVTTVVVVAAVVIAPRIPKARFITTEVFGNDIYFQVEIMDDDATITDGTLKIVAQNAVESHEQSLEVGWQQGSFGSLKPNTEYDLLVMAAYGFGEGVLAKSTVKTAANYGGRIVGWQEAPPDPFTSQEMLLMDITTSYNDLKSEIASVKLKFAFLFLDQVPTDGSLPVDLSFTEFAITEFSQITRIELFAYEMVQIYLVFEATLKTSEVVVLDEANFPSPLQLHPSFYQSDIGANYMEVSVYPDFYQRTDIVYEVNLIKDGVILDTKLLTYTEPTGQMEQGELIKFTRLKALTHYHVQLLAKYTDAITQRPVEKEVGWIDFQTTLAYSYQITQERTTDELIIDIALNDPNLVLSNFSFNVYLLVEGMETFQTQINGDIIDSHVIVHIPALAGIVYVVKIYATKSVSETLSYSWSNIGIVTN